MESATWYLGPRGDLRALTCPERGVKTSLTRYGGVHQGLSGARTMDITGHRHQYDFQWTYMDSSEWAWLQSLHTRFVKGPHFLINPLKKNLLSIQATTLESSAYARMGVESSAAASTYVTDFPVAASTAGSRALRMASTDGVSIRTVRFDRPYQTGVMTGEAITGSVWLKGESALSVSMVFDWYDKTGTQTGSTTPVAKSVTTSWTRFDISATVPAGVAVVFALIQPVSSAAFRVAAPQLEHGSTPTAWELGGGSSRVLVDQLATESPRYPLTDATLTLLEA